MREIKFRAWHKNIKTMCENVKTDLLDRDYLEFMQYTGMKDCNEVEIYEGDIVELSDYSGTYLGETLYRNGCFYFKIDLYKAIKNVYIPLHDKNIEFKVIGNVYDNLK